MRFKAKIREQDDYGSGEFRAPRGDHEHEGIDFAAPPGSILLSDADGTVTKLGYPYAGGVGGVNGTGTTLRYVEITRPDGVRLRYFYVDPIVSDGDTVQRGEPIGVLQSLRERYPGITEHCHFECKSDAGHVLDPHEILQQQEQLHG